MKSPLQQSNKAIKRLKAFLQNLTLAHAKTLVNRALQE